MQRAFSLVSRRLLLALLPALLASCQGGSSPPAAAKGPIVLAASSLQEALTEVAAAWKDHGHAAPVLSFAATSALARQVQQGAPADLFFSADEEWMDRLDHAGLVRSGTRGDVIGNQLVLIGPKGTAAHGLADLGDGRLSLADPAAVPAGKYAKAALESLGQWDAVAAKVAPAENVRAALALVERGEAPLGIVYATDALASDKVQVVATLPASSHPPIRYAVAVLTASQHPDAAGFRQFLQSAEAARIFEKHGFGAIK